MQARFIQEIGTRGSLRVYWDSDCPNCSGSGTEGYHNAEVRLGNSNKRRDWNAWGKVSDYRVEQFPTKCDHCQRLLPQELPKQGFDPIPDSFARIVSYQVFTKRNYDSPSGDPEVGDLFYIDWYPCFEKKGNCIYWGDQCDGRHLVAICPGGGHWDIMSRASNCTKPKDNQHRCWIAHGTPPMLTVDKSGLTCDAGAGSIQTHNWHGFLRDGKFTT